MTFFEDMAQRGMVAEATTQAKAAFDDSSARLTAYIGFDPTAPSLHIGSLLPVVTLARLQRHGHRPIALIGGGTGLIGDPSGKESERPMMSTERLAANLSALRGQLEHFLDFDAADGAMLRNNADWLTTTSLIDFLRDVGKHFSVNSMVARESVRRRLEEREQGISYTEFSYGMLQAYDFKTLYDREGCTLQLGGTDQWGNILDGIELIRRDSGGSAHGMVFPLLQRSDGKKFGKSEKGNIWIDEALTSPYDFFQYWLNVADEDAGKFLKRFTFLEIAEIARIEEASAAEPAARIAQRTLAQAVTKMVHGDLKARSAESAAKVLFGKGTVRDLDAVQLDTVFSSTPSSKIARTQLADGMSLVDVLMTTDLFDGRGKATRAIKGNGIAVNDAKVADPATQITADDLLFNARLVLRRGKKTYRVVEVVDAP